ncbi:hypothetical protein HELRODRAFT_172326 [Helobdella robusta]|uniref:Protein misato homolog 1 n=1 Tax=Helobdella robusta TaxID=6412 RepID=T1F573_HELRO|nr:hypothetical protein HELRODRAFT_172326 [Helobdella robusta]ESO04660.1 hypothetical protein HELRODRAFT_172326 [Helobdella robusta]
MSSSANEIITLQFGHYANFVGTHFWNIQTSTLSNLKQKKLKSNDTNYDAIFREGKTLTNESTYTPRVIFYDLKNSLNTLKSDGTLYDFKKSTNLSSTWLADINLYEVSTVHKNDFLNSLENDKNNDSNKIEPHHCRKYTDDEEKKVDSKQSYLPSSSQNIFGKHRFKLDNEVNVWSDFLRPHLHPKSIEIINAEFHDNAEAFDLFCLGSEAYCKQKYDIEDKIHFFTEECDNLQGFHILADTYNAFSGFSVSVFEDYLLDEFPNKGCLVVNTFPRRARKDFTTSVKSLINTFLSYESFLTSASVLPLSTENSLLQANSSASSSSVAYEHLNYNPNLPYHTSALLAVGLDQLSLKYRSHGNSVCLKDYLSGLTFNTHKLLSLSLSLPFSLENNSSLFRMFNPGIDKTHDSDVNFSSVFRSLSPGMCKNYKISAQHAVFSGLTDQIMYGRNLDVSKLPRYANKFELLNEYLMRSFNYNSSTIETFKNAMTIDEPFPHIFSPSLIHANLLGPDNIDDDGYVNSVPVASVLQNSSAVGGHLDEILSTIERVPRHSLRNFIGSCMELDDFNAKLENLRRFRQNYSDSDIFS